MAEATLRRPVLGMAAGGIVASAIALLTLGATGILTPTAQPGIPIPQALTRWGLPAATGLRDFSAATTLGALVVLCLCLPARTRETPWRDSREWNRLAGIAALAGWAWTVAGVAALVFAYADISGLSLYQATLWETLPYFATDVEVGQYLSLNLLAAVVTAAGASVVRSTGGAGLLTMIGLAGLWPVALNGHAAGALNHDIAVNSQAFHIVGASVWIGGLVAVMCLARFPGHVLAPAVRRYSSLALACFVMVTLSGLVNALLRVEAWSLLWTSYGAVLLFKTLILVAVGVAGAWQRRRIIARLEEARTRVFLGLAAAEALLMAAAVGFGVALGRMAPPVTGPDESPNLTESLIYFRLPGPLDWPGWITTWRPDALWVPVAIAAVAWYVAAVVKLRRRGDKWSLGRTAAWVTGWVMFTWATSGSPGVYGKVLFSMHMVQHMTIATAIPTFFALAAPVTLLLRSTRSRKDGSYGPREWVLRVLHSPYVQIISHPLVAAGLFIVSLVAFYYGGGLFELSMRSHTAHVVMAIHFLITGYLFANSVVGTDPGQLRPSYPMRVILIMVVFAYHAVFSVSLMASNTILARDWFNLVHPPWADSLADDQNLGASIGWALGDYPLAIIAGALIWQWVRADHTEQKRYDRKAARDGDAELAAYNAYLQALAKARDDYEKR